MNSEYQTPNPDPHVYNGPAQVYCIKPEGRIHWYNKG